jgi:hypothetical protein
LQDTLRLLTLCFEYGHWPDVYDALVEGMKTIQIDVWLQVSIESFLSLEMLMYQDVHPKMMQSQLSWLDHSLLNLFRKCVFASLLLTACIRYRV